MCLKKEVIIRNQYLRLAFDGDVEGASVRLAFLKFVLIGFEPDDLRVVVQLIGAGWAPVTAN